MCKIEMGILIFIRIEVMAEIEMDLIGRILILLIGKVDCLDSAINHKTNSQILIIIMTISFHLGQTFRTYPRHT